MICPFCHKEIEDDSSFCGFCGAEIPASEKATEDVTEEVTATEEKTEDTAEETMVTEEVTEDTSEETTADEAAETEGATADESTQPEDPSSLTSNEFVSCCPKKKCCKGLVIGIISAIIILGAAAFAYFKFFYKPDYTAVFEKYANALETADVESLKSVFPAAYIDYVKTNGYSGDEESLNSSLQASLDQQTASYTSKYGEGFKVSYNYKKVDTISKNDLEAIEETFNTQYGVEVNIEKGVVCYCAFNYSGTLNTGKEPTLFNLILIDGTWCLYN